MCVCASRFVVEQCRLIGPIQQWKLISLFFGFKTISCAKAHLILKAPFGYETTFLLALALLFQFSFSCLYHSQFNPIAFYGGHCRRSYTTYTIKVKQKKSSRENFPLTTKRFKKKYILCVGALCDLFVCNWHCLAVIFYAPPFFQQESYHRCHCRRHRRFTNKA